MTASSNRPHPGWVSYRFEEYVLQANATTFGHNFWLNQSSYDKMSELEKNDLMRHEFYHLKNQWERYGPSFSVLYQYEDFIGKSIEMSYYGWQEDIFAREQSRGNKYEYEAYLEEYRNTENTYTNTHLLPY